MNEKRFQRVIVFNQKNDMDSEPYQYMRSMPDFGLTKELIVEFFRNNDQPNLRLKLMQLERKLTMNSYGLDMTYKIKAEIIAVKKELGIITPEGEVKERITTLRKRARKKNLDRVTYWRINKEIAKLESKE